MPRPQDILFAAWGVVIAILLALHLKVAVFALIGAFACGSVYVFAGMIPSRQERFWSRAFTTVFLAVVVSSLVLIVPGTFGAVRPSVQNTVIAIAALLPVAAFCFEIVRTPHIMQRILRTLGRH